MLTLLIHLFDNAEAYTALLVAVVIPLGYWECFHFLRSHFGMFRATERVEIAINGEEQSHAPDRQIA